jgi:protein-arginine kinase activator protein McsA
MLNAPTTHSEEPAVRDQPTIATASREELEEALRQLALKKAVKERKHEQICPTCENRFKPSRLWQRFCSANCSNRFHAKSTADRIESLERRALAWEVEADRLLAENRELRKRIAELEARQ